MVTIQEQQTKVSQARQQIEQRRQEAQKAGEQLAEAKRRLPKATTQRALRQTYAGLKGREQRRKLHTARKEITSKAELVKQYKKELVPYETEITKAESQLKEIELKQTGFELAKHYFEKGRTSSMIDTSINPYLKDYLDKLHESAEYRDELLEQIQAGETPKYIEDQLSRMQEGGLTEVQAYKEIGLKLEEKKVTSQMDKLQDIKDMSVKVDDRTERAKLSNFTGFALVSAKTPDVTIEHKPTIKQRFKDMFFRDETKPSKETYVSAIGTAGAFLSESPTGAGATAYSRPPTPPELSIIEGAQKAGEFKSLVSGYQEKIVQPLAETKIFKGYETYVVDPLSEKVIQPTGRAILTGLEKYEEGVVRPIRERYPSLGETPVGQIAETKRYIERLPPEKKLIVGLPGQKRIVTAGEYQDKGLFGFGKQIFFGEVEESFGDIGTRVWGEEKGRPLGKIVSFGSELGTYVVPGGFGAQYAIEAGEATLGGKFGGQESLVGFVKERPVETALVGGLGIWKGVKLLRGGIKQAKYSKYLRQPEAKIVDVQPRQVKNVIREVRYKPSVTGSVVDDVGSLTVAPRGKGVTKVIEYYPTKTAYGTTTEVTKFGTFKGKVVVSPEKYKEVIDFGDDITRLTEIGTKGKGTVKILKGGKEVYKKKIISTQFDDILKQFGRPKVEKLKFDAQQYKPLSVTEKQLKLKGKRVGTTTITDDLGEVVITDTKPSLQAKKVVGEFESRIKTFQDVPSGRFRIEQEMSGFKDIIKSGERKAIVKVTSPKGQAVIKKKVAQEIVFGADIEKDLTKRLISGKKELVTKLISPPVSRQITEVGGRRVVSVYLKPGTKKLTAIQLAEKAKLKVAKEYAKKAEVFKPFIEENIVIQDVKELSIALKEKQLQVLASKVKQGLPTKVVVEPTKTFLKTKPIVDVKLPVEIELVSAKEVPLGFIGGAVIAKDFEGVTPKEDVKVDTEMKVTEEQLPILSVKAESKMKARQQSVMRVMQRPKEEVKTETKIKQVPQLKTEMRLLQALKSQQKQAQRQFQKQVAETGFPRQPTKPKPPVPPPIFKLGEGEGQKKKPTAKETIGELFKVFTRKEGIDIEIGEVETKKEAFRLLSKKLKSTLRASGFVQRAGQKIRPMSFGGEFRPGKVDPFRVVERKEKRLRKRTTGKQIQVFRKSKTGWI